MIPIVSVIVLNYKQVEYVEPCLAALHKQTYQNMEIIFIDNASDDGSVELVKSRFPRVKVIANNTNIYFSKAHNLGIKAAIGDYLMPLNVDIITTDTYISQMVRAIEISPVIGMVSGKLLQMDKRLTPIDPPVIDSTGLWFTPELRHFDRGSLDEDVQQFNKLEYIFGPSGAAPMYRRTMLEDICDDSEYFDEDFVIYREDADLAWRAQLLGWKGVFTPLAIAYHLRRVRPTDNRKQLAPEINMHSVKNRFLMRVKNQTLRNAIRCFWPTLLRDIQVIGYIIFFERSSLPAIGTVIKLMPKMMNKRRYIMSKKIVSDDYLAYWFSKEPKSIPYVTIEE